VYDGDGNRVAKTVGGTTTRYLVDDRNLTGYAQVLEEIVGGSVQRVYTYGLNRISQSQAGGTSFYGYDGHGNVRLLTDSAGAVTDHYDYDAFGNVISQSGTTPNVYLYSGEQSDSNLGLYYLRARYLSQSTGRFWAADRFEGAPVDPLSLHKYIYANGNPINRRDPSGNISLPELTLSVYIQFSVLVFPAVNYVNSNVISSLLPGQSLTPLLNEAEEFVTSGQFDRLLQLAGQLSATGIPSGPAVFYARDAFGEAATFARTYGLKLLDDYPPGELFDQVRTMTGVPAGILDQLGQIISYQYALRASGTVNIFLPVLTNSPLRGFSSNLYAIEFPALVINSSVTEFIIHFADGTVRTLSPALFESFALGGSLN
jgi:RHS repeat-associated protein